MFLCEPTMTSDFILIYCTCPNKDTAEKLATTIIENELAACANIVPNITSIYRWQGKVITDQEQLLLLKTDQAHYLEIENLILTNHPYDVPEIIATPLQHGQADYLNWIHSCLS
ncbi:MAG: divalent-cation tolerance protein CutA [Methylococcales bacterium]